MKAAMMVLCALGLAAAVSGPASAQRAARGKAELTVGSAKVSIDYGRPALHGRTVDSMLSQLPNGPTPNFWRLGANQSTTFSTSADLDFGGTTVPKGEYSLWAHQEDNSWKLVFNTQHGQWGTQHDPSKDLVSVPLTQTKASNSAETVTIGLQQHDSGGEIKIQWGDLELAADFAAK
ncbi:MAG TPA: DUF2911 domain-containing protein [Terriglobia bacterium]|nr:DUF2911 domain-containing protein [Terriglobia bacterium]